MTPKTLTRYFLKVIEASLYEPIPIFAPLGNGHLKFMKRLCIIAARSGSKGLPNKNILEFAGKPLLAHSIIQATESGVFDAIAISSDSELYLEIAKKYGATHGVARPEELSGDEVAKQPVLRHTVRAVEHLCDCHFDVVVDLQPTSPLRRAFDISSAVQKLEENSNLANVISISSCKVSPYFNQVEIGNDNLLRISKSLANSAFSRRQDIPKSFQLNGSIYAWRRQALFEWNHALTPLSGYWEMPQIYGFDIDHAIDFDLTAFIASTLLGWPSTPVISDRAD